MLLYLLMSENRLVTIVSQRLNSFYPPYKCFGQNKHSKIFAFTILRF